MKFKVGDKVKIIQRKPGNKTGSNNYDKPNGDVGTICYVCEISTNDFRLMSNKDDTGNYYGLYDNKSSLCFQDDDLELIEDEFVLPERWCVEVTKDNVDVLEEWRNWKGKVLSQEPIHGYLTNTKIWFPSIPGACEEITFEQFKKYVFNNMKPKKTINTYGLQVGDKLPQDVICKWTTVGKNRCHTKNGNWEQDEGQFIDDRKIVSFDIIDNVVGFEVSGTESVYLRAEGFKEFMDSFNESKFEVGKWYKSKCGKYIGKLIEKSGSHTYPEKFPCEQYIYKGKFEVTRPGYFTKSYMSTNEVPLSEIQQYLPEDYPDKIKTMKYPIGKIKVINICDHENVGEYTKHGNYPKKGYQDFEIIAYYNNLYVVKWIGDDGREVVLGFKEDNLKPFVSEEESVASKSQFKKGDYVVCLPEGKPAPKSFSSEKNGGVGFKANYCFKLSSVNDYPEQQTLFPESHDHGFWSDSVRYATDEEIAEYNRLGKPYDVTTLNVRKDDKGRPLKTFEVGKWYTNPFYPPIDSITYKYFRVSSVKQVKGFDNYWYNKLEFDKVADENWNIVDVEKTQSNTNFDQEMQLVENPFEKSLLGRYLRALVDSPQSTPFRKGEYVKILDFYYSYKILNKYTLENGWCYTTDNSSASDWELMPEGFIPNTETKFENMDNLIEEAKRRYPVGTKFFPAHISDNTSDYCIITEDSEFIREDDRIYSKITSSHEGINEIWVDDRKFPQYGNTSYNRTLYYDGKWAEIMEEIPKSEDWQPKPGDWVVLMKGDYNWNSSMNKYVGKCVQLKELINKERSFWVIQEDNGKWAWEYSNRVKHFRKAEPHEIPKTEEPKSKPMNEYTAEEALAELKRRGFKKGVIYTFKYANGEYDERDICEAEYEPRIRESGRYIDCGRGYLWHKNFPSDLHRGPMSRIKPEDYPLTLHEVVFSEKLNKPNYFKPETLLPKTTLNY